MTNDLKQVISAGFNEFLHAPVMSRHSAERYLITGFALLKSSVVWRKCLFGRRYRIKLPGSRISFISFFNKVKLYTIFQGGGAANRGEVDQW